MLCIKAALCSRQFVERCGKKPLLAWWMDEINTWISLGIWCSTKIHIEIWTVSFLMLELVSSISLWRLKLILAWFLRRFPQIDEFLGQGKFGFGQKYGLAPQISKRNHGIMIFLTIKFRGNCGYILTQCSTNYNQIVCYWQIWFRFQLVFQDLFRLHPNPTHSLTGCGDQNRFWRCQSIFHKF